MTTPPQTRTSRRADRGGSSRLTTVGVALLAASILLLGAGCAGVEPVEVVAAVKASSTPTPTPTPEVTYATEPVLAELPFGQVSVDDPNVLVGTSTMSVVGVPGVQTTTYRVTYVDGVETAREVMSDVTTTAPVDAVTSVGTMPIPVAAPAPAPAPVVQAPAPAPAPVAGGCDPNYSGQCVPIASDVDCAGGSGNGPAYTPGPVQVIGTDIYDLDRDGDGIACD